jgi:FMN-dependent NADH-azoreductase
MDLPEFTGDMMDAKYAVIGGADPSDEQKDAWGKVTKIFNDFADADHYVFSIPMWNFNIPYKLKHFIDIVTQPGLSWSYNPDDGYKGLMGGRTATVIYASGDGYSEGTGFETYDLQKPYIELWLTFIGFDKIEKVITDRTLFEPEEAEKRASDVALKLANIHSLK